MNRDARISKFLEGNAWQIQPECARIRRVAPALLDALSERHFELVERGRILLCARAKYSTCMVPQAIKVGSDFDYKRPIPYPVIILGPEIEAMPDAGALMVAARLLRQALAKVDGLDEFDAFAAECVDESALWKALSGAEGEQS